MALKILALLRHMLFHLKTVYRWSTRHVLYTMHTEYCNKNVICSGKGRIEFSKHISSAAHIIWSHYTLLMQCSISNPHAIPEGPSFNHSHTPANLSFFLNLSGTCSRKEKLCTLISYLLPSRSFPSVPGELSWAGTKLP